jgi:hypothetical protein
MVRAEPSPLTVASEQQQHSRVEDITMCNAGESLLKRGPRSHSFLSLDIPRSILRGKQTNDHVLRPPGRVAYRREATLQPPAGEVERIRRRIEP